MTKRQRTRRSDTRGQAVRYRVKFDRDPARKIAKYGVQSADFNPTIAELIAGLECDPKQYEKKQGRLSAARSAKIRFRDVEWRAVFTIDEDNKTVRVVTLDKHDEAYRDAKRRI